MTSYKSKCISSSLILALKICLAIASFVLVSSCTEKEPVKLGFVGGLSGRVADLGISGRDGVTLAVEEWNQAGGIRGRSVVLQVKDDKQDEETAQNAVRDLIDQKVEAIIGHMTSAMSATTLPIINEHKVLMISPTTTTKYLKGLDDYFFRVVSSTTTYANKMSDYVYKKLELNSMVIIYDLRNKAYTESWAVDFRDSFRSSGGTILTMLTFHSSPEVQFHKLAKEALAKNSDGVLIVANSLDTAMLCQQIRKFDKKIQIVASEWSATEGLIDLGGEAVEGIIISQFFDRYSTEFAYTKFRDTYRIRFGSEPGFASVSAYDATNIVLESLKQQKQGTSLKDTIISIADFQGIQGAVSIDKYGDAERETFPTVVRKGEFRRLE